MGSKVEANTNINPKVVEAMTEKLKSGLGAEKGEAYMRKIVFLAGIKSCVSLIKTAKDADEADKHADRIASLVASQTMQDMKLIRPFADAAEVAKDANDTYNLLADELEKHGAEK